MDRVILEVSGDEALVLYDWLASLNENRGGGALGAAEQRVLWDLEAKLESKLGAILTPDYKAQVFAARQRIADGKGDV